MSLCEYPQKSADAFFLVGLPFLKIASPNTALAPGSTPFAQQIQVSPHARQQIHAFVMSHLRTSGQSTHGKSPVELTTQLHRQPQRPPGSDLPGGQDGPVTGKERAVRS
jgi:hypothetical protein